jgi:hypothetical protein
MAMIDQHSGCKVGWETYDNEEEAKAAAARESIARERKAAQGYDFGYQWPGSISTTVNHPKWPEHEQVWIVVTT